MTRKVVFVGADSPKREDHSKMFLLLYQAFAQRGSATEQTSVSKADKRADAAIVRALKVISVPIGDAPKSGDLDGRYRRLSDAGGPLELQQSPEWERLVKFVDDTKYPSVICDDAYNLEQFLSAAETIEPAAELEKKKDAKP